MVSVTDSAQSHWPGLMPRCSSQSNNAWKGARGYQLSALHAVGRHAAICTDLKPMPFAPAPTVGGTGI